MGQSALALPETLQQDLQEVAQIKGTSLSEYVLDTLTQCVRLEKLSKRMEASTRFRAVPLEEVAQQYEEFLQLRERLGPPATEEELDAFLDAREPGEPEPDLDPKAAAYLKEQIALARARRRAMAE